MTRESGIARRTGLRLFPNQYADGTNPYGIPLDDPMPARIAKARRLLQAIMMEHLVKGVANAAINLDRQHRQA